MNEDNGTLALEALTDFLNAVEAGIESARQTIKTAKHLEEEKSTVNLNAIKWTPATGPHGPYEKSLDLENIEYQTLLAKLTEHDGKMTVDGWFIWAFGEGGGIGRKLRRSAK